MRVARWSGGTVSTQRGAVAMVAIAAHTRVSGRRIVFVRTSVVRVRKVGVCYVQPCGCHRPRAESESGPHLLLLLGGHPPGRLIHLFC